MSIAIKYSFPRNNPPNNVFRAASQPSPFSPLQAANKPHLNLHLRACCSTRRQRPANTKHHLMHNTVEAHRARRPVCCKTESAPAKRAHGNAASSMFSCGKQRGERGDACRPTSPQPAASQRQWQEGVRGPAATCPAQGRSRLHLWPRDVL